MRIAASAARRPDLSSNRGDGMSKLLVAVDGSECSARAVKWAMEAARACGAELHAVTVQPTFASGDIRRFVTAEMIETYQREEGEKALAAARRMLDEAGIQWHPHIVVGHVAEALCEFASRNACTQIVMGTRGLGGVAGLILGSVASQVIHAAPVPVTLVK